jgi:DNA-binding MarR family transcriptional regulator
MSEQPRDSVLTASRDQPLDPVAVATERYSAAFPDADMNSVLGHLLLIHAGNELHQAVGRFLSERGFRLTGPRYSLMRLLYLTPEKALPQGEIARALNVTSANVTQLIDGLEREGLVERLINAPDRRVTFARLTAAGESRCAEMVPAMVQLMESTLEAFSAEEKAQLVTLLQKFRSDVRRRFNLRERRLAPALLDSEAS